MRSLKTSIRNIAFIASLAGSFSPVLAQEKPLPFTKDELIRGFNLTVFGSEYPGVGVFTKYVHKFNKPVQFYIHDHSTKKRKQEAEAFILSLNKLIIGVETKITDDATASNFDLHIVDKADYKQKLYDVIGTFEARKIKSRCIVKSHFSKKGNQKSIAVIVSDLGDTLFKRCLIEEVLQGLGPLNEDESLNKSVFNDHSKHSKFTLFDRYILNMLYNHRIKNGDRASQVKSKLGIIFDDLRVKIK